MHAYLQGINKTIYCLKTVCLYIALKDTIDPLNFGDSFGGSLDDASNEEPSTLTIPGVLLPVNSYLFRNPFAAQNIDQNTGLNTDSIADFNTMQSNVPLESNKDNPQLYQRWKHVSTFSFSACTPGFNQIRKSI